MSYDAFISYSHAADGQLAPAVQRGLQRFAKRWNQRRALRVFRDQTGLSANPDLWSSIEEALGASRHFILFASPDAAASSWVNKELDYWLTHNDVTSVLIALTDGDLVWDPARGDFDHEISDALPPALAGAFPVEPLHVDLRWARRETDLSLRHSDFRSAIADLAAPIHGRPKDELEGEDIRQHRRLRRVAFSGITALAVLAIAASWFGALAIRNAAEARVNAEQAQAEAIRADENAAEATRNAETAEANAAEAEASAIEARRQSDIALSRSVSVQAELLEGRPDLSLLLHVAAIHFGAGEFGERSLMRTLAESRLINYQRVLRPESIVEPGSAALNRDGSLLATIGDDGRLRITDLATAEFSERVAVGRDDAVTLVDENEIGPRDIELPLTSVTFDDDEDVVVTATLTGQIVSWRVGDGWSIVGDGCPGTEQRMASTNGATTVVCTDLFVPSRVHLYRGETSTIIAEVDGTIGGVGMSGDLVVYAWTDVEGAARLELVTTSGEMLRGWDLPTPVRRLDFSGDTAALGMLDGSLATVNVDDGTMDLVGGEGSAALTAVRLEPARGRLYTGDAGGRVTIRDNGDLGVIYSTVLHDGVVHDVTATAGGETVSTGYDTVAWSIDEPGTPLRVAGLGSAQTFDIAFRSAEEVLVIGVDTSEFDGVTLMHLDDPQQRAHWTENAPRGLIVTLSEGPRPLAIVFGVEPSLSAFDHDTGEELWSTTVPQSTFSATVLSRSAVAVNADGSLVAVASAATATSRGRGSVLLFSGEDGEPVEELGTDDPVTSLAFSDSGELLVAAGSQILRRSGDGPLEQVVDLPRAVGEIVLAPDGRTMAVEIGGGVSLLETDGYSVVRRFVEPDEVWSLAFTPDGTGLAAGTSRGTTYLWDVETGELLVRFGTPSSLNFVFGIDFAGDGSLALATQRGPVVYRLAADPMVRAACELAGRELTEDEWAQYLPERPYESLCG